MITTLELKNMHSNELRELRDMVKKELDFRADVGSELKNKEAWMSSTEWSEKVQKDMEAEERERSYAYIEESARAKLLTQSDKKEKMIRTRMNIEKKEREGKFPHIKDRMESMRDWERIRK